MTQTSSQTNVTVTAAPTGAPTKRRRRGWDDAPLRTKLSLLVMLAAVGGGLVGIAESHLGHVIWPFALGMAALITAVLSLGQRWVCAPFDQLERQADLVRYRRRAAALRGLPVTRRDEIGRLARAMHEMALVAIRDRHTAARLRRTIDDRIVRTTRRATRQLQQLAMRDPLTNLGNRRFLDNHLEPLVRSIRETEADLICMLIDVDNFKPVNDGLGHAVGDELLVLLAGLIRGCVRYDDIAVRFGGDEIVVLMPGCTVERAGQVASQLIALFRQQAGVVLPKSITCGLSIGVASLRRDGAETGRQLIEKADTRLYAAKRSGKGQVAGC